MAPTEQSSTTERDDGLDHRSLRFFGKIQKALLNAFPWHKLPKFTLLPLISLVLRRRLLQRANLTEVPLPDDTALAHRVAQQPTIPDEERVLYRPADGYGNDGANPAAGAQGYSLGRNVPILPEASRNVVGAPHPQLVAQRLLARRPGPHSTYSDGFIPAGMQLNVLAAAWIQTMIHDWLDHLVDTSKKVTLDKGAAAGCPLSTFSISPTTNAAPPSTGDGTAGPDTIYLNNRTGWWDASFLYGQTEKAVVKARTGSGGKLHVAVNGVPTGEDGKPLVGDRNNGWAGVSLLQDIFSREHNAVAELIAAEEPGLDDEGIFRKARLVVSAVVAKIHTIDWTVELLKERTLYVAMNANWKGLLNLGPKLFGLVGASKSENHGVPFNLTEEFTSVYRMHMMIPDTLPVAGSTVSMTELVGDKGISYLQSNGVEEIWKSVVRYPCGALNLFNYPETLRNIQPDNPDTSKPMKLDPVDLAAVDIYRDRERGVPRYNEFRKAVGMPPKKSWKHLTGGDKYAMAALQEVYGDNVDNCDLMVGNLAEKKIKGFAISETAFFIFILMASRRLEADRFFTEHFTEAVYGKAGFKWVKDTKGMKDVLARHLPSIAASIPKNLSAFTPFEAMPHTN